MLKSEIDKDKMLVYMNEMDAIVQKRNGTILDVIKHAENQVKTVSHPTEYALAYLGIRDALLAAVVHGDFTAEEYIGISAGTAPQTLNIISLAYVAEIKKKATEN